jgi:membrane protein
MSWTVLEIARTLMVGLRRERVPEAAAAIGFYAVFSLFPFLLLLVALGSMFLQSPRTQAEVAAAITRFVPLSQDLIAMNVGGVLKAREAVGALGALGLIWSATSAFTMLVRNLDRAWPRAVVKNVFKARLTALAIAAGLAGLSAVVLGARACVRLAVISPASFRLTGFARLCGLPFEKALVILVFAALLLVYRLVPSTRVLWREAAGGAAGAALASWAATRAFAWYLGSGLARYNLVYGSLGALLGFLSWVYVAGFCVLGGAHLSSAISDATRPTDETSTGGA